MYATRDLKPGDIISVADRVLKLIHKNAVHKRCVNCFEVNDMNLLPCPSCVSTMFCSKKCQEEATKKFHKLECSIIDEYRRNEGSEVLLRAWRTLLISQQAAGGSEKLKATLDNQQLLEKTFFDYDLSKDCKDLALNEFLSALGHISAYRKFNIFTPSIPVIDRLLTTQPMRSLWNVPTQKKDLKLMLEKLWHIYSLSFHETFDGSMNDSDWKNAMNRSDEKIIGSGVNLPFIYFNHSCSPNAGLVSINSTSYHFVTKPIKKDEQIFENYM